MAFGGPQNPTISNNSTTNKLTFYFEELKISISNFPIFNKELKKPEDKKMPFFSLVGISTKDNWLCARGRGGGLAIWVKS